MATFLEDINDTLLGFLDAVNNPLGTLLVFALAVSGVWFTIATKGVQFRLIKDMLRLLVTPEGNEKSKKGGRHISPFQAFAVSIAARVGTGNLAGVATAIVIGGPGAVFWMWVMALIGSANAFIESTLAQLFKIHGNDSYIGGPAYYIRKGLKSKVFAFTFAIAIIFSFGLAQNMVQANTISLAFNAAYGINNVWMGVALSLLALLIIFGGIQRVAKFSSVVVPFMAIAYVAITIVVILLNIDKVPGVLALIVKNAFGIDQAVGGSVGAAILIGFKRGLFSNEAGEGSAPNVAATATTTHPAKQGLIQALGVFTDTLIICTCTAFIILCSGQYGNGHSGIELTQDAFISNIGSIGYTLVAVAIFFFAFSTIIANYYYGECNLYFMTRNRIVLFCYRVAVGLVVLIGSVSSLELVWGCVDLFVAIVAIINITAILLLGKYAIRCLQDYVSQKRQGINPEYHSDTIPEIEAETESWKE